MRDAAVCERSAASQVGRGLDVFRAHDAVVVYRYVHEQFVEFHILLRPGVDQIVIVQAGNRKHRLAVELSIVQSI